MILELLLDIVVIVIVIIPIRLTFKPQTHKLKLQQYNKRHLNIVLKLQRLPQWDPQIENNWYWRHLISYLCNKIRVNNTCNAYNAILPTMASITIDRVDSCTDMCDPVLGRVVNLDRIPNKFGFWKWTEYDTK